MQTWFKTRAPGFLRARAGGALVIAAGAFFVLGGMQHELGTLRRMGPGAFPVALGLMLLVLGAALTLVCDDHQPPVNGAQAPVLRPMLCVFGGIIAFAFLAPRLGFVPATIALMVSSALARPENTPLFIAVMALAMAFLGWAVFVVGLGVPLFAFAWKW